MINDFEDTVKVRVVLMPYGGAHAMTLSYRVAVRLFSRENVVAWSAGMITMASGLLRYYCTTVHSKVGLCFWRIT